MSEYKNDEMSNNHENVVGGIGGIGVPSIPMPSRPDATKYPSTIFIDGFKKISAAFDNTKEVPPYGGTEMKIYQDGTGVVLEYTFNTRDDFDVVPENEKFSELLKKRTNELKYILEVHPQVFEADVNARSAKDLKGGGTTIVLDIILKIEENFAKKLEHSGASEPAVTSFKFDTGSVKTKLTSEINKIVTYVGQGLKFNLSTGGKNIDFKHDYFATSINTFGALSLYNKLKLEKNEDNQYVDVKITRKNGINGQNPLLIITSKTPITSEMEYAGPDITEEMKTLFKEYLTFFNFIITLLDQDKRFKNTDTVGAFLGKYLNHRGKTALSWVRGKEVMVQNYQPILNITGREDLKSKKGMIPEKVGWTYNDAEAAAVADNTIESGYTLIADMLTKSIDIDNMEVEINFYELLELLKVCENKSAKSKPEIQKTLIEGLEEQQVGVATNQEIGEKKKEEDEDEKTRRKKGIANVYIEFLDKTYSGVINKASTGTKTTEGDTDDFFDPDKDGQRQKSAADANKAAEAARKAAEEKEKEALKEALTAAAGALTDAKTALTTEKDTAAGEAANKAAEAAKSVEEAAKSVEDAIAAADAASDVVVLQSALTAAADALTVAAKALKPVEGGQKSKTLKRRKQQKNKSRRRFAYGGRKAYEQRRKKRQQQKQN